jgi:hypothetical protein
VPESHRSALIRPGPDHVRGLLPVSFPARLAALRPQGFALVKNNWQCVVAVAAVPTLLAFLNHYLASRRERKKLASAMPQEPDAWLLHAVYYVLHRRWPSDGTKPVFPMENTYPKGFWENVLRACDQLRQKAFNGDLRVWGMSYRDSLSVNGTLLKKPFRTHSTCTLENPQACRSRRLWTSIHHIFSSPNARRSLCAISNQCAP